MKSLEKKIEVMQAALDGKEIEYRSDRGDSSWAIMPNPEFDGWSSGEYRIKPEPLEFFINIYTSHPPEVFSHPKDASRELLNSDGKTIKVRQVID